ncbi:MAG: response regulator [Chloroflexi bacterium]|nr:response regulator [Chloroflexota bacterium]
MKKILIVEDIDLNIDLLTQILEDDYELIVARDGAQGVALAVEHRPDAIVMDMSLPIIDGWEATRRIRANEVTKDISIIGLSAHAMSGDADKAITAGCSAYLTKPIDDMLLLKKLSELLGA